MPQRFGGQRLLIRNQQQKKTLFMFLMKDVIKDELFMKPFCGKALRGSRDVNYYNKIELKVNFCRRLRMGKLGTS